MKTWRVPLLVVVILAVTFSAAFAITHAAHDSPNAKPKTQPVSTANGTVPLVAPIASGDPKQIVQALTAPKAHTAAAVSPVVGASPVVTAAKTSAPGRANAAELASLYAGSLPTPPSVAGSGAPATPPFVDPCAGDHPGGADPSCGTTGVGGTITPVDMTYLWVAVITNPDRLDRLDPGWRRCSFPDNGGAPIVVVTSMPVDAVRVESRGRTSLGSRPDYTYDLGATSTAERTNFTTNHYDVDHWYRNVQACTRIVWPSGTVESVNAHASVTTPAQAADSDIQWLFYRADKPRPPVQISFDGANTMHVITPVRSATSEATTVTVLRADGSDGPGSCHDFDQDPDPLAGNLGALGRRSVGNPADAVSWPTPPPPPRDATFDLNYDKLLEHTFTLEAGTPWLVCITWSTQPATFDASAVSEREQWRVTTPGRVRVTLWFDGVDAARSLNGENVYARLTAPGATDGIVIHHTGAPGFGCSQQIPITDTNAGLHNNPSRDPLCDPQGLTDSLPNTFDIVTQVGTGTLTRSRVTLDATAHNRSDTYALDLGGGAGRGLFHVSYGADDGLPAAGTLTPDGGYEARPGLTLPPPDRPQLDFTTATVAGGRSTRTNARPGTGVDSIVVDLVPDRDVDAHVYVVGFDGTGDARACLRTGAAPERTLHVAARASATAMLTGLCAGTTYYVSIELHDAAGHTSVYTSWGIAGGTDSWDGIVTTNTYRMRLNIQLSYNGARPNQDDLQASQLDIGFTRIDFSLPGRSDADPVFNCLGSIGSNGFRYLVDVDVTEQVDAVAHWRDVRGRSGRGACHIDNPTETFLGDATTSIDIESLRRTGTLDVGTTIPDGPIVNFHIQVAGATVVPG